MSHWLLPPLRRRRRWLLLIAAVLLAAVAFGLLSVRGCTPAELPEEQHENLLTPRALAQRFDVRGILKYIRTDIRDAQYAGVLRGAYGALWAGEANAWDRVLLAAAALNAKGLETLIVPDEPPRLSYRDQTWLTVRLDADVAPQASDGPPHGALAASQLLTAQHALFHEMAVTLVLEKNDGRAQRVGPTAPQQVAEWAYQPVILLASDEGQGVHYALRVGGRTLLSSESLSDVRRASLELAWRYGGQTSIWNRELFDRAVISSSGVREIPGHDAPRAGDRYAIVLAAGPLVAEVLHTRARMMELVEYSRLPDFTDRDLTIIGTSYLVKSDERALELAKETGVRVAWNMPRVAIVASEVRPAARPQKGASAGKTAANRKSGTPDPLGAVLQSQPAEPAMSLSLDVLADAVQVDGERAREFQLARGLADDLLETRVVYEATQLPVVSASTVFARYAASVLETPARHIRALSAEAQRLLADEPVGTRVKLRAQPPRFAQGATPPDPETGVSIERAASGLVLSGVRDENGSGVYAFELAGSVSFGASADALAVAAEGVLERLMRRADYLLGFELVRAIPPEPLPLAQGVVLTYGAVRGGKSYRMAVQVSLTNGVLGGTWLDLDTGRHGPVAGAWPSVLELDASGNPAIGAFLASSLPGDSQTVQLKVRVGESERDIEARKVALPGETSATLLPLGNAVLVLAWQQRDTSLVLQAISPVVYGRVLDADTAQPVVGALISRSDNRLAVRAAADGTFIYPITTPLFHRLILVLDRSGSMFYGLDPKADRDAPAGERRLDALRRATNALLDQVPPGVEVALWSFTTPKRFYGDHCSPDLTKVDADFTTNLGAIRGAVDKMTPESGTPLTGAVIKILDHVQQNPASRDAVVVLLTDGENTCTKQTMTQAYKERNGQVAIHTVGFAIEPGGQAERDLRDLAKASGGTYHGAGSGQELTLTFHELAQRLAEGVRLSASAAGYEPSDAVLDPASLGRVPIVLRLATNHTPGLLTIRRDNLGDLERAQGLSPKAKQLIAERVRDGAWSVTIPQQRVSLGSITAYGWFESEESTGRLVGRTEDGLHGSGIDPNNWPSYKNAAGKLPFVAWFEGLTAYTAGAVNAALLWHRDPSFMAGGAEAFKRFVQANALEFAAGWWDEVGSSSYGNMADEYWAGVCLNFALQSKALNLNSDSCQRYWAYNLCTRVQSSIDDAAKEAGGALVEPYTTKLKAYLRLKFGKEWGELIQSALEKGFDKLTKDLQDDWDDILTKAVGCQRLKPKTAPAKD